jgi:CBS domain-containing protein
MATIQDILERKGGKVVTIEPGATALDAIEKMNHNRIGSLVVMDGDQVVGIFTERDVLKRVASADRRPGEILVTEVMTGDVACCATDADVDEVGALMKERRIRHVPVCGDDGRLVGLISIGDINAHHASAQAATIHFLNDYIYGRV